eukprot:12345989-Prorocentrum_lima.AAC.1
MMMQAVSCSKKAVRALLIIKGRKKAHEMIMVWNKELPRLLRMTLAFNGSVFLLYTASCSIMANTNPVVNSI